MMMAAGNVIKIDLFGIRLQLAFLCLHTSTFFYGHGISVKISFGENVTFL